MGGEGKRKSMRDQRPKGTNRGLTRRFFPSHTLFKGLNSNLTPRRGKEGVGVKRRGGALRIEIPDNRKK